MSKAKINLQDLVPDDCNEVVVKSRQDLLFLGRENLEAFRARHQKSAQSYSARIRDLQKQIRAVAHQDPNEVDSHCRDILLAMFNVYDSVTLELCIEHLVAQKRQLEANRRQTSAKVSYLTRLMAEAKSKPCFAYLRSADYFRNHERAVWLPQQSKVRPELKGRFLRCDVGPVWESYVDIYSHVEEPYGEHFNNSLTSHKTNPCLIPWQDFLYFNTHPDYLELWLQVAAHQLGSKKDIRVLKQAFQQSAFTC